MSTLIIEGNAIEPIYDQNVLIAHICNNLGYWGKGFVMAIESKWPNVSKEYKYWVKNNNDSRELSNVTYSNSLFRLGEVQFVKADENIMIANMIAQNGIKSSINQKPISYEALDQTLTYTYEYAKKNNFSIHMPKIGSGLAGGDWNKILSMIEEKASFFQIETIIYIYNG